MPAAPNSKFLYHPQNFHASKKDRVQYVRPALGQRCCIISKLAAFRYYTSMNKKFDVYGMGNALVDVQFQVSEQTLHDLGLDKGGMRLVDTARQNRLLDHCKHLSPHRASGGSAANSMIAIAQLGGRAAYGCLVGDDELGRFYFGEMQSLGVRLPIPPISGQPTGTCIILITPDAERTMNTSLGASGVFEVGHVTEDALKQATWLYLEGYLFSTPGGRAAAGRAIELARKHRATIALTFSDRFIVEACGDALRAAVAECDLIFANEHEAGAYVGKERTEDIFSLFQHSAPQVVMTSGEHGAWGNVGGTAFQVPAVPTRALDATGAGDMFAGAFLYALTHHYTPEDAARLACRLSSKVVSQLGPRLHDDVTALLRRG